MFKFFVPLGIQIEMDFNNAHTRIKLHLFRALKWYLNDENLARDRKTTTIWNFTARNFNPYFS